MLPNSLHLLEKLVEWKPSEAGGLVGAQLLPLHLLEKLVEWKQWYASNSEYPISVSSLAGEIS